MRKRQRHFKPKAIAATAAFDARYITGLSDGNAVTTWSDISGNSHSATQGTVALQPVYKAAVLGGGPAVRFDGAGDNLSHTIANTSTCSLVLVINRLSTQTNYRGLCSFTDVNMLLRMGGPTQWGTYTTTDRISSSTIATSTPSILTLIDNAASGGSFFRNSAADGTWTGTTTGQGLNFIGGYYTASPLVDQTSNVDIAAAYLMSSAMTASVRKRVEQGFGFSFKIACS